ncbi:MAG: hypothetical protein JNM78_01965 [Cyclobacteriaceae bacterium]|nr:hypothetical protein [Cyclobacteriaceae bacterium]
MKKFNLLFVGVLFCTLAFANGTVEPNVSSSTVAVTNSDGGSVFKLFYKGEQKGTVKVSIMNEKSKIVFSESIKSINGFVRPYNFSELQAGTYILLIEDSQGIQKQKVIYTGGKIEKYINLVKLKEEGKYLLSVKSTSLDRINVSVYDQFNKLIHSQDTMVKKDFAEVLNLKNINHFIIEISDSHGMLKSLKN